MPSLGPGTAAAHLRLAPALAPLCWHQGASCPPCALLLSAQHHFFQGPGYLELDIDIHAYQVRDGGPATNWKATPAAPRTAGAPPAKQIPAGVCCSRSTLLLAAQPAAVCRCAQCCGGPLCSQQRLVRPCRHAASPRRLPALCPAVPSPQSLRRVLHTVGPSPRPAVPASLLCRACSALNAAAGARPPLALPPHGQLLVSEPDARCRCSAAP